MRRTSVYACVGAIVAFALAACGGGDDGAVAGASSCPGPTCDERPDVGACNPICVEGWACIGGRCIELGADTSADAEPDTTPDTAGGVATLDVDWPTPDTDDAEPGDDAATDTVRDEPIDCAEARLVAENVVMPADIVVVVDTSGSMDQESRTVESKLGEFSTFVTRTVPDLRVVLIGDDDVCVTPPLSGAPGCPDTDSAQYRHVVHGVDSSEVFSSSLDTFDAWADFLQPGSSLHFVAVTDDDDDMSWSSFETAMEGRLGRRFTFHAIVAQGSVPLIGCVHPVYGAGAAIGREYMRLALETGGVSASICTDDWTTIFDAIAGTVVEGARLPCGYDIPDPGPGLEVDPDAVNVYYTPARGAPALLPNVDGPSSCGGRSAWYFDDPDRPTRVILCDAICGENDGEVAIEFGCDTVKI